MGYIRKPYGYDPHGIRLSTSRITDAANQMSHIVNIQSEWDYRKDKKARPVFNDSFEWIVTRFRSNCTLCNAPILRGESVLFLRQHKIVLCHDHSMTLEMGKLKKERRTKKR